MINVEKIQGAFYVTDHNGEILVGYKNRKFAEASVKGAIAAIYNAADDENARRDGIAAYLATRAARPAPEASAQLELF